MGLHGKSAGIDPFLVPAAFSISQVPKGHKRKVIVGEHNDEAVVEDTRGDSRHVIEGDIVDFPLLTLSLDQGPQGMAGAGFTDDDDILILYNWDKIHRIMRDIKLSLQHACGGVILKAHLFIACVVLERLAICS